MAVKRKTAAPKKSTVKKATRKVTKAKKRFIFDKTISKSIRQNGLVPNYPNEKRTGKIGSFKVSVTRANRLNYYGNPVYSAYVEDTKTKKTGYSKSDNHSVAISSAIKKTGVNIKYTRKK